MIAGFITASGILIATSQLKSLLGIKAGGAHAARDAGRALAPHLGEMQLTTLAIGLSAHACSCSGCARGLKPLLLRAASALALAAHAGAKAGPVLAIVVTTTLAWRRSAWRHRGVRGGRRRAAGPAAADPAVFSPD